ncbi:hypothetical protein PBCV1_A681aL [Paramecium bursaria Chlorella virus 1]|uniref:Uncharacterized protein n=1 Tax=Paramecium bursaria Chlorella virus 1 TaxID=10506 RepID=F8TU83_PBCV1|nr:hypothetical protein PBCV1_A681aL [Paramecium bursaria Chlorella virus 1]AEI70144.1 hypothetical protein [Paramecium bursaria Chlorella virus 1]
MCVKLRYFFPKRVCMKYNTIFCRSFTISCIRAIETIRTSKFIYFTYSITTSFFSYSSI